MWFSNTCRILAQQLWNYPQVNAYFLLRRPPGTLSCFHDTMALPVGGGFGAFLRWWPPSMMWAGPLIYLWPTLGMFESSHLFEIEIMCCMLNTDILVFYKPQLLCCAFANIGFQTDSYNRIIHATANWVTIFSYVGLAPICCQPITINRADFSLIWTTKIQFC